MRVIESVREMREFRRGIAGRVALVATLGGMHAGHEAHLVAARDLTDVTIGSLFLNPTQFSAAEDLDSYPQDRNADLAMFERNGAAAVFAPAPDEMYPQGSMTTVSAGRIATVLEGAHRPGHFDGVATVVTKLLALIRPDVATFGEKDAQQLRVIESLNDDLNLGVEIARIPTVRESDGLALSSRNQYLNPEERLAATVLYRGLMAGRAAWDAGERNSDAIRREVLSIIEDEPLASLDYVSIADRLSFEEITGQITSGALILVAARIGSARLIDNISLD